MRSWTSVCRFSFGLRGSSCDHWSSRIHLVLVGLYVPSRGTPLKMSPVYGAMPRRYFSAAGMSGRGQPFANLVSLVGLDFLVPSGRTDTRSSRVMSLHAPFSPEGEESPSTHSRAAFTVSSLQGPRSVSSPSAICRSPRGILRARELYQI